MTDDQKKILQLENELEKLAGQLDFYRREINQLKKEHTDPSIIKQTIEPSRINKPASSPSNEGINLENFIGLRLLHLAGIVVLVIGISIGVKFAVDKELISPVARIILAYSAGAILYFLSVRVKKKFVLFSAILFSGAMASLYFTTYAALVYYELFPFGVAFGIMVLITIFTAYMAIRYDKQEIAILGMIGAYGIPFLISSNSGRADLFFSYIILINSGIVFLSWRKEWKAMVRLAMLVSWTLFIGWAGIKYSPPMLFASIVFMVIFYGMFAFAAIGFSIRKKEPLSSVEIQLYLLNNVLAFLAALLVFTDKSIDERSTNVVAVACIIFSLQAWLVKIFLPAEKIIFSYLIAFAVLCGVGYVGMKWDGLTVTMLWLLIAIALFVTGVISKTGWLRLLSIVLLGVTLGKLILIDRYYFTTGQKIISYISIGILLLLLSYFYQKFKTRMQTSE